MVERLYECRFAGEGEALVELVFLWWEGGSLFCTGKAEPSESEEFRV
jgi:hypothetical protein